MCHMAGPRPASSAKVAARNLTGRPPPRSCGASRGRSACTTRSYLKTHGERLTDEDVTEAQRSDGSCSLLLHISGSHWSAEVTAAERSASCPKHEGMQYWNAACPLLRLLHVGLQQPTAARASATYRVRSHASMQNRRLTRYCATSATDGYGFSAALAMHCRVATARGRCGIRSATGTT